MDPPAELVDPHTKTLYQLPGQSLTDWPMAILEYIWISMMYITHLSH